VQIRTTRYVCDSCGNDVPKKAELRRFSIRQSWDTEVHTDLCAECESKFVQAVEKILPADELPTSLLRAVKP
jgi:ribosomal protein S26